MIQPTKWVVGYSDAEGGGHRRTREGRVAGDFDKGMCAETSGQMATDCGLLHQRPVQVGRLMYEQDQGQEEQGGLGAAETEGRGGIAGQKWDNPRHIERKRCQ